MGKSLSLFLIIAFVLTITASLASAARPLSTDDAGTVEERHIEIESGFEYVKQPDKEYNLSFVLKYGLAKKLDLGVEIPYQFIDFSASDDVDGVGDIKFSAKYHFLDKSERIPAVALSYSVKADTGDNDKGIGSGDTDHCLNTIFSKEIGSFTTHLNLGYTFVGEPEGEDLDDVFSYSLALEYPINERLNIVGEITAETTFEGDFDDNPFSGLAGFNYAFNETVCFDFGVGFEISEASPDYKVTTGLTFGF